MKTGIASIFYLAVFYIINYLATKDLKRLDSADIKYWNEFGQETYGRFSIFISIVGGLYILWYRTFSLSKYELGWRPNVIYIFLQLVSIGMGYAYWKLQISDNDKKINLILTTFIACPMILITYSAFYGIWVSNDYSCYEHSFVQSQDFNPKQIKEYNAKSTTDKLRMGAWKPRTRKDCKLFSMIFLNVLSIAGYTISTAIYYKPVYVALTLGAWISITELSILLVIKYRESNFNLTPPIASICSTTGVILLFWIIYIFLALLVKKDDNDD